MSRPRLHPVAPLDAAFLLTESASTPMHVGALMEFTAPDGAGPDYLRTWQERLREPQTFAAPFNLAAVHAPLGGLLPIMREIRDIDLGRHVHLWGLPGPGSQRELGVLVSRLHGQQLDFSIPLWELHVIDGLEGNRFAMYLKIHHSVIDGVSAMRHIVRTLSSDPDDHNTPMIWSVPRPRGARDRVQAGLLTRLGKTVNAVGGLASAVRGLHHGEIDGLPLRAPYAVPDSPLGAQVTSRRRLATQSYELALIKALASAADCTVNDIVLYLCGTALRSYLGELDQLPDASLTAGIPVSLREPGDERPGTAVGFLVAELGTHLADPVERLAAVVGSATAAKRHLRTLPEETLPLQSILVNAPYMAGLLLGLGSHSPIAFSLAVSNVRGPAEQLYFNGARLEGMYPVSMLTHGNALNITCVSHDTQLDFGFVGAGDALPHLQRLAVAMGDAVDELSALLLPK